MARARRSYAWSLHTAVADIQPSQLSDTAYAGLGYAEELAREAGLRSSLNLPRYKPEYLPLTIDEIAAREGLPPSTITRRIAQARRELFGQISDAAIYKRLQRAQAKPVPRDEAPRVCDQPGCDTELGPSTHRNRHYCAEHRTAAARTRRHRRSQAL